MSNAKSLILLCLLSVDFDIRQRQFTFSVLVHFLYLLLDHWANVGDSVDTLSPTFKILLHLLKTVPPLLRSFAAVQLCKYIFILTIFKCELMLLSLPKFLVCISRRQSSASYRLLQYFLSFSKIHWIDIQARVCLLRFCSDRVRLRLSTKL